MDTVKNAEQDASLKAERDSTKKTELEAFRKSNVETTEKSELEAFKKSKVETTKKAELDVAQLGTFHVGLITLASRPDRLQSFRKAGVSQNAKVFLQPKHPNGARTGIFAAHIEMIAHFVQENQRRNTLNQAALPFLGLEDDAVWTERAQNDAGFFKQVARSIELVQQTFPAWDCIWLGGIPCTVHTGFIDVGIPHMWACTSAESHAFLLSPAYMERVLVTPHYGGFDHWLSRTAAQSFSVVPEILTQDPSVSSDNNPFTVVSALRTAYKTFATTEREVCVRALNVKPHHVHIAIIALFAFALGRVRTKALRYALLACFVAFFVIFLVDTTVQDSHVHDREMQPPLLDKDFQDDVAQRVLHVSNSRPALAEPL